MNCERCNNKVHFENDYGYSCAHCVMVFHKKSEQCCTNPNIIYIQLEYENGGRHQRKACLRCKEISTKSVPKDANFKTYQYCSYHNWQKLKQQKEQLSDRLRLELNQSLDLIREKLDEKNKKEFHEKHSYHIKTDKWRMLRKQIIERENNICQGCRKAPIQEIHHDTYVHLENEFLFQLIGLCHNCHSRFHNKQS